MSLDDEQRRQFRRAVADAIRLPHRHTDSRKPRPKPIARFREADEHKALEESLYDPRNPDEYGSEPPLEYVAPGVQKRLMRRLRRGTVPVQGVLDLHGKTQAEAHPLVADFLETSIGRGHTCVRIIHGKGFRSGPGGPVLKVAVARWLSRRHDVLAYCSTRPVDGGTGAVYVLLRRDGEGK
ncbi:MAG: Smr/MutS family protein [Gammaproteobacteria bacterium]